MEENRQEGTPRAQGWGRLSPTWQFYPIPAAQLCCIPPKTFAENTETKLCYIKPRNTDRSYPSSDSALWILPGRHKKDLSSSKCGGCEIPGPGSVSQVSPTSWLQGQQEAEHIGNLKPGTLRQSWPRIQRPWVLRCVSLIALCLSFPIYDVLSWL